MAYLPGKKGKTRDRKDRAVTGHAEEVPEAPLKGLKRVRAPPPPALKIKVVMSKVVFRGLLRGAATSSEPPKRDRKMVPRENCRKTFWCFSTIFDVFWRFLPCAKLLKSVEKLFDAFWRFLTFFDVAPFRRPLLQSADVSTRAKVITDWFHVELGKPNSGPLPPDSTRGGLICFRDSREERIGYQHQVPPQKNLDGGKFTDTSGIILLSPKLTPQTFFAAIFRSKIAESIAAPILAVLFTLFHPEKISANKNSPVPKLPNQFRMEFFPVIWRW